MIQTITTSNSFPIIKNNIIYIDKLVNTGRIMRFMLVVLLIIAITISTTSAGRNKSKGKSKNKSKGKSKAASPNLCDTMYKGKGKGKGSSMIDTDWLDDLLDALDSKEQEVRKTCSVQVILKY